MNIRTKLLFSFLAVALITGVSGYLSLSQFSKIAEPLATVIPQTLVAMTKASHSDQVARFIGYADEVLTQSARNYAFTQDKRWEKRYAESELELKEALRKAITDGGDQDKAFFSSIVSAQGALADIEHEAIARVNDGNPAEAIKLLESSDYWDQKVAYKQRLIDYIGLKGANYDDALSASTETLNHSTTQVQKLVRLSTELVTISIGVTFLLAAILSIVISTSISQPIKELTTAAKRVQRGDFNHKIPITPITSRDEIGQLARTFDTMRQGLKDRNDLLNSMLKTFRGRFGNIAFILMRKDISELTQRSPSVMKSLPPAIARTIKKWPDKGEHSPKQRRTGTKK